jgi:hypothetical protein
MAILVAEEVVFARRTIGYKTFSRKENDSSDAAAVRSLQSDAQGLIIVDLPGHVTVEMQLNLQLKHTTDCPLQW